MTDSGSFGRTDDTFKVAGKRVGPGEIEDALTTHPTVSEAAVIGVPDEIKGTDLVCFVGLKDGGVAPSTRRGGHGAAAPSEPELIAHVARRLGKPLTAKCLCRRSAAQDPQREGRAGDDGVSLLGQPWAICRH
jgi:acetyl-CoA synthetase